MPGSSRTEVEKSSAGGVNNLKCFVSQNHNDDFTHVFIICIFYPNDIFLHTICVDTKIREPYIWIGS